MKKIEIYQSFEEQENAQYDYLASLSHEESMSLFFQLMKRAKKFSPKITAEANFKRKIVIHDANRFWR